MNTKRQANVWEKWDWAWNAVFYATVLISFGLALLDDNRAAPLWAAGLLTAFMLLWHWGGLRLAFKDLASWDERVVIRFVIIIGDIVLWFVLVNISPAYYFALFGLFIQVFRNLPIRYAAVAIFLLTATVVFEQIIDAGESFTLTNPAIWSFLFMVIASVLMGIWISAIIEQSSRRRELIEQLEVAQAELSAAERRVGVLEERQRLAREIHDTLAQGFTSIVMHLEAAEQALPDDLDTLQKHLDQARGTARSSLDEARRVVQDLRPDLLEQQSLPDAIERTVVRWGEESGIAVTTTITGEPAALHPDSEVTLLRAAQAALNNIRKHAQATAVQLTLSYKGDMVILDVKDDGVGLRVAEPSPFSGGYGLQAMRERADLCGGSAILESEPGEGTTVMLSIPIAE